MPIRSRVRCDHPRLDALFERIRGFLLNDISEFDVMGSRIRGYRSPDAPSIWLRDYSDMMRGFRYWERDMTSVVDHFAEMQSRRGWVFDSMTMDPEKIPCERENWAKYVRVPVEADVEFRFVNAAYLAWQSTGDDAWLRRIVPRLDRALDYIRTDPLRRDARTGLVKRAFTIDTWDFDYTAGRHDWLNFRITPHTYWGIMHGDNSGYAEAYRRLGALHARLGDDGAARRWRARAERLRRRANALCFNGRFYRHRVPLVPCAVDGVDEDAQLSLSNPMDINRGMPSHAMAVRILDTYSERGRASRAFAPWFSIDPPFPAGMFGDPRIVAGAYCNGGIMPLVGGELARAAFEHGRERFGVEQLLRYEALTRAGSSYLWYFPDGTPPAPETSTSPDASPTDGWGSSAMLYALMEGLAGVTDEDRLFRKVRLAPRWIAADVRRARVRAVYGASGAGFSYDFLHDLRGRSITLRCDGRADVSLHLLLPDNAARVRVLIGDRVLASRVVRVEHSRYVRAAFTLNGGAVIRAEWA